jgi:hypothetical protein
MDVRALGRRGGVGLFLTLVLFCGFVGTCAVAAARAATQGDAIVAAAASQAGRPYCFAGGNLNGPTHGTGGTGCGGSTVGFDCTGLTLYAVYQATGKDLSHDGRQATEGGQIIHNTSELLPGDLVFFGGSLNNFEHAGVYAGGGKIWDALNEGIPVQLHTLAQVGLPFVGGARYWSGGGGPLAEGSFVSHNGFVYRIAGGAPIYVSSWSAVGGPQPSTPLSDAQFAALPQFPRDGTILDSSGGGVFIAAGGAPLYLSSWNAIGGPKPGIGIDQAAIDRAGGGVPWDHLRAYPADGTILDSSGGGVFIVAGGAPLYLSSWNAIGGPRPGTVVDQWDIDRAGADPAAHLRAYPEDGTILDSTGGGVFIVAGGAPLYLSNWDAIGGPKPGTLVDQWDIDRAGADPAAHLRAYPEDGALIGTSGDGRVYEIVGGAPLYVSSWNAIGGARPATSVDQWDVNNTDNPAAHLRQYPLDGTFVNTSAGRVYRIVGGAPFYVSNWSVFGGVQPYVNIDQWDVDNTADPHSHLRAAPLDGTLVEGLPSSQYWGFSGGLRSSALSSPGAIAVDDASLAAFPLAPSRSPEPVSVKAAPSKGKRHKSKGRRRHAKHRRHVHHRRSHR